MLFSLFVYQVVVCVCVCVCVFTSVFDVSEELALLFFLLLLGWLLLFVCVCCSCFVVVFIGGCEGCTEHLVALQVLL